MRVFLTIRWLKSHVFQRVPSGLGNDPILELLLALRWHRAAGIGRVGLNIHPRSFLILYYVLCPKAGGPYGIAEELGTLSSFRRRGPPPRATVDGSGVAIPVGLSPNVTLTGKCLVFPSGHKIKKKTSECRTSALQLVTLSANRLMKRNVGGGQSGP